MLRMGRTRQDELLPGAIREVKTFHPDQRPLILGARERRVFAHADAYATAHADRAELERALVKLYRDNAATLTPDPLHSAFYDSHPPAAVRIARLKEAT